MRCQKREGRLFEGVLIEKETKKKKTRLRGGAPFRGKGKKKPTRGGGASGRYFGAQPMRKKKAWKKGENNGIALKKAKGKTPGPQKGGFFRFGGGSKEWGGRGGGRWGNGGPRKGEKKQTAVPPQPPGGILGRGRISFVTKRVKKKGLIRLLSGLLARGGSTPIVLGLFYKKFFL